MKWRFRVENNFFCFIPQNLGAKLELQYIATRLLKDIG